MTANPTTVIIGGVAGGMSTATRLRRNDEKRNIISSSRPRATYPLPTVACPITSAESSKSARTFSSKHRRP